MSGDSFPRQHARTRRFSLGVPRAFTPLLTPSGPMVLFLRTDTGSDAVTHLMRHDPAAGVTTKLVDARELAGGDAALSAEERARRERSREQADGIVSYATDAAGTLAAFVLGGALHTVDLVTGAVATHDTAPGPFDPQPAPDGAAVAYHAGGAVHLLELDGPAAPGRSRTLVAEEQVSWGRAEFIAAEEMGRSRGFWWDADGRRLAITRVDERQVVTWTLADPAEPATPARSLPYPAAGTTNAEVSLWVVDIDTGDRTRVQWDTADGEYLARVLWGRDPLTVLLQPRDQRTAQVCTVEPATGATTVVRSWSDPAWVELVPGSPCWSGRRLLTVEDRVAHGAAGSRALCVDGDAVTPPGLQVRSLLAAGALPGPGDSAQDDDLEVVHVLASPADDPTRVDPYEVVLHADRAAVVSSPTSSEVAGIRSLLPGSRCWAAAVPLPAGQEPPWVETTAVVDAARPTVTVGWRSRDTLGQEHLVVHPLEVVSERPAVTPRPRFAVVGDRRLRTALLLPSDDDGTRRLPVVLDPYGGPHAQRVLAAAGPYLVSQWLADQGFAVLVTDGRGSPGRGPQWERAVHHDLAGPALDDQIDALHAVARDEPRLDLDRVAIRGWSFGGYLAALAVLRAPEVFRAAIAGAPVTDWMLYDTHYTERYLGHPAEEPAAYARSSLVDATGRLPGAVSWEGGVAPSLLLIHGLADDNVVVAHTLRLSRALLHHGRDHRVLPLSGVTHMTPQEEVAERLLTTQVRFLGETLGDGASGAATP